LKEATIDQSIERIDGRITRQHHGTFHSPFSFKYSNSIQFDPTYG
jgi:hypothetical protein